MASLPKKFVRLLFFGNYFYGICAAALSVEAMLQQRFPLNRPLYFILAFAATVLYYSKAYITTEVSKDSTNKRSVWYANNRTEILWGQLAFLIITIACGGLFAFQRWENILALSLFEWLLVFIFPVVAVMYYGLSSPAFTIYTLRNIGWLKPFIIGFIWAGLVTVYPIIFYCIDNGIHYTVTLVGCFLFIKNFMYVTVLCIMFDIKDYAMDYNQQLKTFVVKAGLRNTIFYIIIPLCILGLAAFIGYAVSHNFNPVKIMLNTIPFILTIIVAYSLHNRKNIFYYLVIIDGLMLVKAVCGTIGMLYF